MTPQPSPDPETARPRFCEFCEVSLDLHPDGPDGDWSCDEADRRARLIESAGAFR